MPAFVPHRFYIVDVFAEERFTGNPLAVVCDAADLDAASMQRIAHEFGFSETTFLVSDPRASEPGVRVRIFTPAEEMPFAGHPTLGTAWVIREHLAVGRPAAVPLALGVGRVPVTFEPDPEGRREMAWLEAPPVTLGRTLAREPIARALGLAPADVADDLPVQHVSAGIEFVHVPLVSVDALAKARLDPAGFAPLAAAGLPCAVYWFARSGKGLTGTFHARMQWYARSDAARTVREDPATGSAAACLGAYLLAHRGGPLELLVVQGVELGRASVLRLEASAGVGAGAPRIRVGGRVVEVARGELL
jgi:trans-2,3-dihydro-3-hydroxyanthranilate isomerase